MSLVASQSAAQAGGGDGRDNSSVPQENSSTGEASAWRGGRHRPQSPIPLRRRGPSFLPPQLTPWPADSLRT